MQISSKLEEEIVRQKTAYITISAAVCAAEDVLRRCSEKDKSLLDDLKISLAAIYYELNAKTEPKTEVLEKNHECIKNGFKKTREILNKHGHKDIALKVLREKIRFLVAVLETHIKHMVSV